MRFKRNLIAVSVFLSMLMAVPSFAAGDKSVNVWVNPLGLIIGWMSGGVDFKISDSLTIGPQGAYFSASSSTTVLSVTQEFKTKYTAIGAQARYYFSGNAISDGWMLTPFFQYVPLSYSITMAGVTQSTTATALQFGSLIGYNWVWDGGFNMALGLGGAYGTGSKTVTVGGTTQNGSASGLGASFEFAIGYAF